MRTLMSPKTARAARLYRLAKSTAAGEALGEGELMTWVYSHLRRDADMRLSKEEEQLRESKMPLVTSQSNVSVSGQHAQGSMFHFREFPMYPGEYVPAGHDTLSTLRSDLKVDMAAQSLRDAWMKVSGGHFFSNSEEFYSRVEGIDEQQIGEIAAAVLPGFNQDEGAALVGRLLESLSRPTNSPSRQLQRTISAEALGLDNAPGHYSNFLEWLGRISETKAFQTEHALFEFTRRNFNRNDVRIMNENYNLMSRTTLAKESADGYSHFFSVLKDLVTKTSGRGARHQVGVRIDPAEFDEETGIAVGTGKDHHRHVTAYLRENRDRTGRAFFMGKPLHVAFDDRAWIMEQVLWPFDEAGLDFKDFDLYIANEGPNEPFMGDEFTAAACRLAVANAISKLLPLTRPALKKAGLLSVNRQQIPGDHPGFTDGRSKRRAFAKR